MTWSQKVSAIALIFPILLGSCTLFNKPKNKIAFYTLEYEPPQVADRRPLPLVIKLERFAVAPTYNTNRIIYRDQSYKRDAYVYYQWRANPGDLVTQFLRRDLSQSGLFKAILPNNTRSASTLVMEGSVDEFVEWDMEENWNAALTLSVTLMVANEPDVNKRIVFQKSYRAIESCRIKHPRALAEAMSQAMAKVSKEILMDIYDYMKE